MNDDQLLRYSRHILLPEIDVEGQQALLDARALIIGCGTSLDGRLLLLDGLAMEWRSVTLGRDPGCAVCAREPRPA